jgi:hypothetical protein
MEIRGDSNINLLAEGNGQVMSTPQMQQFQERSVVHPFIQPQEKPSSHHLPPPTVQHQAFVQQQLPIIGR